MNPRRLRSISRGMFLILVAAALGLVLTGCKSRTESAPPAPPSSPAEFLKQQNLQGRVALIQFGLVGCELSEAGLGKMAAMQREGKIEGLDYLRVEAASDPKAADDYFAARKPPFPIYRDPERAVGRAFDATAWPTYVLVDKFGHVRYQGPWPDEAKLAAWVAGLRKEAADPGPGAPRFDVAEIDVPRLLDETKLPDLKGETRPLRACLGKAGLVAVFVDTKCPFSAAAVGEMSSVAATLAKHDVAAVLVNLGDPKAAVEEFYAARNVGMPVLYDTGAATQKAWGVTSVPMVLLFDAGGAVAYRGNAVWKDVGAAAEKALNLAAGTLKFGVKGTEFG